MTSSRPQHRPRRTAPLVVLAAVACWLVAGSVPVSGHSILVATTPGPGDEVEGLVEVRFEFAGEVAADGHALTANGPAGAHPAVTFDRPDATTIVARFAEPLPEGEHELVWEVVAGDGHRETGRIPVTVTAGPVGASPAGAATTAPATTAPASSGDADRGGEAAQDGSGAGSTDAGGGAASAPGEASSDGGAAAPWAVAGVVAAVVVVAGAGLAYRRWSSPPSR